MRTAVYVEQREGKPLAESLALLSKAAQLGGEVAAVVCAPETAASSTLLGDHGADRIYIADDPVLGSGLPQPQVGVLERLTRTEGFDGIFFATSVLAADIASGLAARLETGVNWGLVDVEQRDGELIGKRLALGDSVLLEVGWTRQPRVAVFRPGSLEPIATGGSAVVEHVRPEIDQWRTRVAVVERLGEADKDSALESADVIVAGGRGLGSKDAVVLLEELAAVLGGVVAGSMPVVDAGWLPYNAQVGQTGTTVRPKLYVACGISGAIQHRVGMDRSEKIVAINEDSKAPIFDFCDFGVVGDLHEIVPQLVRLLSSPDRQASASG